MKRILCLIFGILLTANAYGADNFAVTAGAGTTIASDDVTDAGGANYQKIKIYDPTANSTTGIGIAANPMQVSLANHGANATPVLVDLGAADTLGTVTTVGAVTTITNAVAVTNAALTSIDGKMVTGTDIGDVTINNAAGAAAVNVQDGGNTLTVDGTVAVTNADITSSKTALEIMDDWDDANYCNVNMNVAGTDVASNAGVLNAQTVRVTIATDDEVNNSLDTLDNCIAGSEAQVDVVAALPTGTNIIGAVKRDIVNYTKFVKYVAVSNTNETTLWDPSAGKKFVVTDIIASFTSASTATIKDAGSPIGTIMNLSFAANGGMSSNLQTPIESQTADSHLTVHISAATGYFTIMGYEV